MTTRFIAKMEDVLDVYRRPYDPRRPVVCMDEKAKELQWHTDQREPLIPQPGQAGKEITRQDYGYKRNGMANMFIVCEPLKGWRRVAITEDRTAKTVAHQLKKAVDQDYPDAEVVVLVPTTSTHMECGRCTRYLSQRKPNG